MSDVHVNAGIVRVCDLLDPLVPVLKAVGDDLEKVGRVELEKMVACIDLAADRVVDADRVVKAGVSCEALVDLSGCALVLAANALWTVFFCMRAAERIATQAAASAPSGSIH